MTVQGIDATANPAALSSSGGTARLLKSGVEFGVVVAAYLAIAEVCLWIPWINPVNAPVWPPTGFALALLFLRGRRVWPAVLVGGFAASVLAGHTFWWSALIGGAVLIVALVSDLLLRLWSKDAAPDALATPAQVARFGLICTMASAMMSALLGAAFLIPYEGHVLIGSPAMWASGGLTDAAGSILIGPAVVLWARTDVSKLGYLETVLLSVVAGTIGIAAFTSWLPLEFAGAGAFLNNRSVLAFFVAAPLAWAALRGDRRSVITSAICFTGAAYFGLSGKLGPLLQAGLNERILFLFAVAFCASIPPLLLAAAVFDRQRREADLLAGKEKLTRDLSRTQSALGFAERHFHLLMEHVTDYAIFLLDTSGRVASWNGAAQRIVGYAPGEIIGSQFSIFYRPDDRRAGEPIRALELAVQKDKTDVEGWWLKKNGEPFFVTGCISTIRNEKGELVGFSSVMRDATERRDAEEKLVEAREQLAMAQKMEAIGKLTGGIAHDFNNLLMIIGGNAQTFKRLLDPKLPRAIDAIQTAAKRGETLTRQLLTFSRRQHLSPTVVDLATIIRNMRPMIESSLRGNIVYNENLGNEVFAAKVDVSELQLAIVNIAVNARDAMPNGGTFTLSMANVAPDNLIGGARLGNFVGVTFQDSGTGIPPNLLSKIFDPFFTTKEVGKGTGLGLSQVYGFGHQAGGTVRAESKVGEGTAITLYLPLCSEQQVSDAETSIVDAALAKRPKVLVVDDSADVAEVTSSLFESLGYQPIYRDSAEAALQLLAEGGRFDLVFSDIVMPGNIDGVGLANEVRTRYPQIPIILTTGYSEVAQTIPPDLPILRKPFDTDELRSSVQDVLRSSPAVH